jgi:hypothetical protein
LTEEYGSERERMEKALEIPLKGTELSEAVEEYWDSQRRRIAFQLKIISTSKVILERALSKDKEIEKIIQEFKTNLREKKPFKEAYEMAIEKLRKIGKLEEAEIYFELHWMIKEGKSFEKIINLVKPKLQAMGKWSSWREERYRKHEEDEKKMHARIVQGVQSHPVYTRWLIYVKGIGPTLAAQVIGGFESALDPGEILGTHFKTVSQMWAYAGLNVENGKAPRRVKGKKLTYNSQLRSVLLGRVFPVLMQKGSQYKRIYEEEKVRLYRRFEREGFKIVPASKLPTREDGTPYEPPGVISVGHIHNMARRKTMKVFVAHFWEEVRKAEGLPTRLPYVFEVLGHPKESYIPPIRDRL